MAKPNPKAKSPKRRSARPRAAPRDAHRTPADLALAERMLAAARAGADVRTRKVRRLRAAIKVRAYENALKLDVATERLVTAAAGKKRPRMSTNKHE